MTNDRAPQMTALSNNTCPNAKPRGIADLTTCDMNSLTTWGYCHECWDRGDVPAIWAAKVDQHIEKAMGR
jgi:hypothetical protein